VDTPDGFVPIEQIVPGELVWSQQENGAVVPRRVTETFVTPDMPTVELEFTEVDRGSSVVRATRGHPFWVVGQGWTRAEELRPGDKLVTHGGVTVSVLRGRTLDQRIPVFNFTVEELHTYFVGAQSVWVHNADPNTPARELRYDGPKPDYVNPGHHDPSSPNFRGGGSRTTPLPADAEQVYRSAVPELDGKTWWGQNADGEWYRFQAQNGEAHWNGRAVSERGLPKPPDSVLERFRRQAASEGCN
jgi:hypothetical protein